MYQRKGFHRVHDPVFPRGGKYEKTRTLHFSSKKDKYGKKEESGRGIKEEKKKKKEEKNLDDERFDKW